MSNNDLLVLHEFANAFDVRISTGGIKQVGKFTVATKKGSVSKTYDSVPISVSDKMKFGILIIDWDEFGLDDYLVYGLYQEYRTDYNDFKLKNGKLIITNSDKNFRITIY